MSQTSLRIVYFSSLGAQGCASVIELLQSLGHQVPLLVMTPGTARRPITAYQDVATHPPLPADVLITSHLQQTHRMIAGLEPDLVLVTGFPRLLPSALLAVPRLGCINLHPAKLPAYRGPDPLFWQIYNGEPEIGMTAHRMDASFDTGPILAQGTISTEPDDTMFPRLMTLGASLLPVALEHVIAGDPGTPQPTEGASYAAIPGEEERRIDWTRSAVQIHNQVRAWRGIGPETLIDGQRYHVLRAHPAPISQAPAAHPGDILATTEAGMLVQTGDGALLIEEMMPDVPGVE